MRVSVLLSRTSVRRPSRVSDPVSAIERPQSNSFLEVSQLAFGAANRKRSVVIYYRNPSGIVSTVFEFFEAVENHSNDLFVTDITDYSAHLRFLRSSCKGGPP